MPEHRQVALLPVATTTRRDGVIAQIKRAIVLGSLQPGEKLTEARLSSELNVSRPTVREALGQLAQEGLLVQEPYRGLRVASLDDAALLDIAETRMALDMQAVSAILADASGHRMELVLRAWGDFEARAFDPDPLAYHEAHLAFHRSIWAASENYLLMRLWPVTEAHITIALLHDQYTRADPTRAHAVHAALIEAFETRDLERIRAAFTVHTIGSARELVALLAARRAAT